MVFAALRRIWRVSRGIPGVRGVLAAVDRVWWARTIRRAELVDLDHVQLQVGRRLRANAAIRAYVRGRHRDGLSLNPLFFDGRVGSQLPDAGRVPALYAYLINDQAKIHTSETWDAPAYAAAHPDALRAPGGPVGAAWRSSLDGGRLDIGIGSSTVAVTRAELLHAERLPPVPHDALGPVTRPRLLIWRFGPGDDDGTALRTALTVSSVSDSALWLVVDEKTPAALRLACAQVPLWQGNAVVVDSAPDVNPTDTTVPAGTLLLVRDADSEISAEDALTLLESATRAPAAPLWLRMDGTIASAGVVVRDGEGRHLLAGHPAQDVSGLGDHLDSAVLDSPVRAFRVGSMEGPRTLLGVAVRSAAVPAAMSLPSGDTRMDALSVGRGLQVDDARWPLMKRTAVETATLPDGSIVPRLRWSVKTAAPAGPTGEAWGDTHFARGLAAALERLGQYAAVDARPAAQRSSDVLDDVSVVLRGPHPLRPSRSRVNLLWIISHPDEIHAEELSAFDRCFAASTAWAAAATTRFSTPVTPLLQCTDPHRFTPQGLTRSRDLVFVGTARGIARPSVVEPLRVGAPVRVYGPDWRGYIPAGAIAGTHVPNDRLPAVYEAAGAVLNDHWPAMQRNGFVSNRLYDVVASGGRAISDDVAGISEIFGPAVRTYRDIPELHELTLSDLDALFPSDDELAAIARRIREEDSFDARARHLLDAAQELL